MIARVLRIAVRVDGATAKDSGIVRTRHTTVFDALYTKGDAAGTSIVWLDIGSATANDVAALAAACNLHPLTVKDCLQPISRDKCEVR